jgi:hypothetical protein
MLCMAGCTTANSARATQPDATPTPLPDEFHAEMLVKRTFWRRQSIPHYRVHFEFVEDARNPVVTRREVFIGNFAIRGMRCPTGACPTSTFKDIQTVSDVFAFMQRIPQSCIDQVLYDPYLYYPKYLSADCAEGIAHPFALRIVGVYPEE